jgi:hypothetical protein
VKQRGERAEEANNVFLRTSYEDVWSFIDVRNADERAGVEAVLSHVGQVPAQLFDRPHPKRDPRPNYDRNRMPQVVPAGVSSVLYAGFVLVKSELKIYFLDENFKASSKEFDSGQLVKPPPTPRRHGSIAISRTSTRALLPTSPLISRRASDLHNSARAVVKPVALFGFNKGVFRVVKPECDEVLVIRTSSTGSTIKHRGRIVSLAVTGDWTAVGDRDSAFALYNRHELQFLIPIFTSSVRCCAIRPDFQLTVCGTRDCSLIFCSMNRGYVTRIIQLGDLNPILVAITHGWGFICVYARQVKEGVLKHILVLYTVNGDVIRQTEIPSAVQAWTTFKDADGFDYIVLALTDLNCYLFEAFYLDLGDPIHSIKSAAVVVSYFLEIQMLVIVSVDGLIDFVPYVV